MGNVVEDIAGGFGDVVGAFTGQNRADELARDLANRRPLMLDGGGLRSSIRGGRLRVTPTSQRRDLVSGIRDVLQGGAAELRDLRMGADTPFERMREAIIQSNRSAERRTVGNLAENLGRRRVLGSSFGSDAIARARAEFAQQESRQLAQNALQELDLKTNLIERETQLERQAIQVALEDLNLQADVAASLTTRADQTINENRQLRLQVAQERASGMGELIGTLGGAFLSNTDMFGGGGNPGGGDGGSDSETSETGAAVGTAAGTAIGSYFGPVGAKVGGAIGGQIGGRAFA